MNEKEKILPETIEFCTRNQECFEFSNYYCGAPFISDVDGKHYHHTEGYFHAQKFVLDDPEWAEAIRATRSPAEAKAMGRSRDHPLRKDWEQIKDKVMRDAVQFKFSQNRPLLHQLVATHPKRLVEANYKDAYWGWGPDKRGKNMLGRILMDYRSQLVISFQQQQK